MMPVMTRACSTSSFTKYLTVMAIASAVAIRWLCNALLRKSDVLSICSNCWVVDMIFSRVVGAAIVVVFVVL